MSDKTLGSPSSNATGRTCPYCRSPLGESEPATECPACNAMHHADCWAENGGCAVPLCEGGPEETAAPPAEAEAPTEVTPVNPASPPAPTPRPPLPTVAATPTAVPPPRAPLTGKTVPPSSSGAPRPKGMGLLPVLAGVIILLGGGTAAAIILTQQHSSKSSTAAADTGTASASSSSATEEASEPFEAETTPETEPIYQPTPPEEVEQALHAHFGRLVADNYTAAYGDLTPSLGETSGGQEAWIAEEREDGLEHFELSVDVSMHGPHAATAEILSFATHAYASGCHAWTGSWEMVKQYGQWLIAAAHLERGSC